MLSLLLMRGRLYLPVLGAALCTAQEVRMPDEPIITFGVTVVSSSGLKGDIYLLKEGTSRLPNFKKLKPVGTVYTPGLNLPPRDFSEGFPGVTDRFEWFAIDYHGRFWISKPGKYRFALGSDDGSRLEIDGKTVIDNDGVHPPTLLTGSVNLAEGVHRIRVSYFQGPRTRIALMLAVSPPGEKLWRIFNTEHYRPPAEKFKDGSLDEPAKKKPGRSPRPPR